MKKAQALNLTQLTINFMFVFIFAAFMGFTLWTFLNEKYETQNLNAKILTEALVYSENCLAFNNGNTNPGIIDTKKISPERLTSCFSNDNIGYSVKLSDLEGNEIKSAISTSQLSNYLSICSGLHQYKCIEKKNYVLYQKDDNPYPGILTTEVIALV